MSKYLCALIAVILAGCDSGTPPTDPCPGEPSHYIRGWVCRVVVWKEQHTGLLLAKSEEIISIRSGEEVERRGGCAVLTGGDYVPITSTDNDVCYIRIDYDTHELIPEAN